ncbi:branched-chain amino acid ABC transporter, periplasmic amino acid-binding protein [Caballeronia arvi]|uniref:Branched-chain amino acid ABC transporter, periplasmic amino acid-binding protein n=2 Tax=Caballeronia arvi TaxID=1777135 RepID=A0A158KJ63_9BURK|nr:branched-chain amino acid ABC transporter, periplasmic amino acid-binding protein [Caballeronia arvi]
MNRASQWFAICCAAISFQIQAAEKEPIVVGSVLDETGALNVYGKAMADATKLAIKSINDAGGVLGRPLKLVTYDAQSDNAKYTSYSNQLALRDRAAVIMGGITSASREAIRPVADRNKTLYFYNEQYEGGVCDKNVFLTGVVPSQQIPPLVDWAIKSGKKKFYVLAADYNYGHISTDWVKQYVTKAGGTVVGAEFIPLDVSEFGSVISKLQEAKPDVVFSLLVGGNHIAFYRQFASAGLSSRMQIASATFGLGNEQVVLGPKEANGIVVAFPYVQEDPSDANKKFREEWSKTYGSNYPYITDSAATVWNGWHLWALGVEKAGSTDRDKVIKALESGISFEGPGGKVSIDPTTHHVVQNVHIARADDKHGFAIISEEKSVAPSFERSVCDLVAKPNTAKQFTPSAKAN